MNNLSVASSFVARRALWRLVSDEDRLSGYVSASSRARATFKLTYCVHDQILTDSNVQ